MTTPIRIGIIGAGAIATHGHIPGFQRIPNVEIVAVCDANLTRAQDVATRFNIPHAYQSYHDLLATKALDAVAIAVPNALHAPITIAALEAGTHVFCEKPLATSLADGQAMVATAERTGRLLAVNMHQRQRAEILTLRAMIAAGELGTIRYAHARWLRRKGIPGFGSWFTQRTLAGGGVLMDIGVHMLDIVLWLMGYPEVIGVRGTTHATHGPHERGLGGWGADHIPGGLFDVEDFAAVHLRLRNGGLITIEVSWALCGRDEERIQLVGDQRGADISTDLYGETTPLHLFHVDGEHPSKAVPLPPDLVGSAWDRSIERFIQALRTDTPPAATGQEALRDLEILDAAYRSAAAGQEITLHP